MHFLYITSRGKGRIEIQKINLQPLVALHVNVSISNEKSKQIMSDNSFGGCNRLAGQCLT